MLATSREALGLIGVTLVPVGALPADAAARLFTDRAAAVAPGEPPAPATVTRICAALDGLPLAIELAAARLRSLSADDVAARLGDRFRLLSRGDRTAEPRHRTLRGVVEWSWNLLDADEQLLSGRFAVFAGGARPAAVERVCDVPDTALTGLVEKSFVEFDGRRYRMLETIRAFCAEQGEDRRAAHAQYFLDSARAHEPKLRGADQLTALAELAAEHADLHAALRWSATEQPETALRLIAALSWYWWLRGLRSEATPIADTVLAAVGPEPPPGLAEEYVLCAIQASDTDVAIEPILRRLDGPLEYPYLSLLWAFSPRTKAEDAADLLCRRADGVLRQGDAETAKAGYEAAAEQARAAGTPMTLARARGGLGEIARRAGDLAAARRWYASALALAADPSTGGETRIRVHTGFGWTAAAEGRLEEATELHQEALAAALEHANLPGAAQAIEGLAGVLAAREEDERAAFLRITACPSPPRARPSPRPRLWPALPGRAPASRPATRSRRRESAGSRAGGRGGSPGPRPGRRPGTG